MIRERRDEDLDVLCAVLTTLGHPAGALSVTDRQAWLTERDAVVSWVFDRAPVGVTPTRNVVGHVEISRPDASRWLATGQPVEDLLVVGRLFVAPVTHEAGYRRHLLKEATRFVLDRGRTPALDRDESPQLTAEVCRRLGFRDVAPPVPGSALMVHAGPDGR